MMKKEHLKKIVAFVLASVLIYPNVGVSFADVQKNATTEIPAGEARTYLNEAMAIIKDKSEVTDADLKLFEDLAKLTEPTQEEKSNYAAARDKVLKETPEARVTRLIDQAKKTKKSLYLDWAEMVLDSETVTGDTELREKVKKVREKLIGDNTRELVVEIDNLKKPIQLRVNDKQQAVTLPMLVINGISYNPDKSVVSVPEAQKLNKVHINYTKVFPKDASMGDKPYIVVAKGLENEVLQKWVFGNRDMVVTQAAPSIAGYKLAGVQKEQQVRIDKPYKEVFFSYVKNATYDISADVAERDGLITKNTSDPEVSGKAITSDVISGNYRITEYANKVVQISKRTASGVTNRIVNKEQKETYKVTIEYIDSDTKELISKETIFNKAAEKKVIPLKPMYGYVFSPEEKEVEFKDGMGNIVVIELVKKQTEPQPGTPTPQPQPQPQPGTPTPQPQPGTPTPQPQPGTPTPQPNGKVFVEYTLQNGTIVKRDEVQITKTGLMVIKPDVPDTYELVDPMTDKSKSIDVVDVKANVTVKFLIKEKVVIQPQPAPEPKPFEKKGGHLYVEYRTFSGELLKIDEKRVEKQGLFLVKGEPPAGYRLSSLGSKTKSVHVTNLDAVYNIKFEIVEEDGTTPQPQPQPQPEPGTPTPQPEPGTPSPQPQPQPELDKDFQHFNITVKDIETAEIVGKQQAKFAGEGKAKIRLNPIAGYKFESQFAEFEGELGKLKEVTVFAKKLAPGENPFGSVRVSYVDKESNREVAHKEIKFLTQDVMNKEISLGIEIPMGYNKVEGTTVQEKLLVTDLYKDYVVKVSVEKRVNRRDRDKAYKEIGKFNQPIKDLLEKVRDKGKKPETPTPNTSLPVPTPDPNPDQGMVVPGCTMVQRLNVSALGMPSGNARWYKKTVSTGISMGNDLMRGKGNNKFDPNAPVTQAEVITAISRAFWSENQEQGLVELGCFDLSGHWSAPYYDAWLVKGLSKEYSENGETTTFNPNKPATRSFVARVLADNAYNAEKGGGVSVANYMGNKKPSDVDASRTTLLGAINYLHLKGYKDGTFKPDQQISRAEFAAMLSKATGVLDNADFSKTTKVFNDVGSKHWAYKYIWGVTSNVRFK